MAMRAKFSVAKVLEAEQKNVQQNSLSGWHLKTLEAIRRCRTAELGGHIDACTCCQKIHLSYNSCRNRHCPTCQGHKRAEWIAAREKELLNVPYFHVVFTMPAELNGLCIRYPKRMYDALFKTAWGTLSTFSKNESNTKMGMVSVLHTWGQNLSLHPHLHCIVPGGGVLPNGRWQASKRKGKFLFAVKAVSIVYKNKLLAEIKDLLTTKVRNDLYKKNWVVYAKQPFGKPENVVEYLGRYSHKIAISNHRIQHLDYEKKLVSFGAKSYRQGGKKVSITLSFAEFIRRFQLHILPRGFTRIRHYGILSSSWKKEKLPALQAKLQAGNFVNEPKEKPPINRRCPACKKGTLVTICTFTSRGPPSEYAHLVNPKTKTAMKKK